MPEWQVELYVYGPVTVRGHSSLHEPKGYDPDDIFYTDINTRNMSNGLHVEVTARAENDKLAQRTALHFVGQALDVLSLRLRLPLVASLLENQPSKAEPGRARRIITHDEWREAFQEARQLNQERTTLHRALSWYRKGLYTEDPFDKFLAFWIAIETVVRNDRPSEICPQKAGVKRYMRECFTLLWGPDDGWPEIAGNTEWISETCDMRNEIAHGGVPVNARRVEGVLGRLETLEAVTFRFLKDWKARAN